MAFDSNKMRSQNQSVDPMEQGKDFLNQILLKKVNEDPEKARDYLMKYKEVTEAFINDTSGTARQKLIETMQVEDKMAMLAKLYLSDIFPDLLGLFGGSKVEKVSFDEEVTRLDKANANYRQYEQNLIYPKPNSKKFGQQMQLFTALSQFAGNVDNEPAFRMIEGSTFVYPKPSGSMKVLDFWSHLKGDLARREPPINLNILTPKQVSTKGKPGSDEIHFVYAPSDGLPNKKELEHFQKIFEDKATPTQWYTPEIVAGIFLLKGASVEDAMSNSGASGSKIKKDLESLHKKMEKEKTDKEKVRKDKDKADKAAAKKAKEEADKVAAKKAKEEADAKKELVDSAASRGLSDGSNLEA